MTAVAPDPADTSRATLEHYSQRAAAFEEGTRDHDVSQNIAALLRAIEARPPFAILDFGCGPGRDLQTFAERGHAPVGLDGAAPFVAMARAHGQRRVAPGLPGARPSGRALRRRLRQRRAVPRAVSRAAASPAGSCARRSSHAACCSVPIRAAIDEEGWNRGRYGAYHSLETWRRYMHAAGFAEIEHYYRPDGLPRDQQPWLASVWRK